MNIKWNKPVLSQPWEKVLIFNIELIKNNCYCGWAAARCSVVKKVFCTTGLLNRGRGWKSLKSCLHAHLVRAPSNYTNYLLNVTHSYNILLAMACSSFPQMSYSSSQLSSEYVENTPPFHYWVLVHNINLPRNPLEKNKQILVHVTLSSTSVDELPSSCRGFVSVSTIKLDKRYAVDAFETAALVRWNHVIL